MISPSRMKTCFSLASPVGWDNRPSSKPSSCALLLNVVLFTHTDSSGHHPSFSPQTHHLCQQHFFLADHKHSQLYHQTRSICWPPFLQPSACDEARGGQWVFACAWLLFVTPTVLPASGVTSDGFSEELGRLSLCLGFSCHDLFLWPKTEKAPDI